MKLIATCAFGLEKLVNQELKKLGLWIDHNEAGRVIFDGTKEDIIRTNLWLRIAERVHIQLAQFPAKTFDELFDRIHALDWPKILPRGAVFPVLCTTANSQLHHEPSIQSISKKAIVKKLQSAYQTSEPLPETGPSYSILVRFFNDSCTVSIDTTGESLHKRGYRTESTLAPIKETLAAALIKFSEWTPEQTLIDPFCGSGTILIEAALMGINRAPGLNRSFAFQNWPDFSEKTFYKIIEEATALETRPNLTIFGYDIDRQAIAIAEQNAKRAGVEKIIHFTFADFHRLPPEKLNHTTIITNPPYGERLSEQREVEKLYQDFGQLYNKTTDTKLFLITSFIDFEKAFGQKSERNRKLYNGKLKCYLYQYEKPSAL